MGRGLGGRGFSILEALVALAFLALAALGVVSAFGFSARLHSQEKHRHEAALIAFDCMEEVRVLIDQAFSTDLTLAPTPHPRLSAFTVERTESFVPEEEGVEKEALKEVVVLVRWDDAQGAKSFRLMERFYRR